MRHSLYKFCRTQKLLKFVRPAYKVDMNSVEKKVEEKKLQETKPVKPVFPARPEVKPQQKMLERLKELKKANELEGFLQPDIEKEQTVPPPKKKVYGVAAKPPPRNLRESDYEKHGDVDVEWVPPEEHESL